MATMTIRNIDDDVKTRLRMRAAGNGWSMEEEARRVLTESVRAVPPSTPEASAADAFRCLREECGGGVSIDLPDRAALADRPLDLTS